MKQILFRAVFGLLVVGLTGTFTGCKNLPGKPSTQGAVIGGVGGAAVGAAVGGKEHRLLGALIGGALGAGGGYIIGANSEKITGNDTSGAQEATKTAQNRPATADEARRAATADVNNDGFVTLDEVVAMKDAGLNEAQMIDRLRATNQVFELTSEQQQYLTSHGVSAYVVDQMQNVNREKRDQLLNQQGTDVISHPQ
jgi:glycine zipper 2TM protein